MQENQYRKRKQNAAFWGAKPQQQWSLLLLLLLGQLSFISALGSSANSEAHSIKEAFHYIQHYAMRAVTAGEVFRTGSEAVNKALQEWGQQPLAVDTPARANYPNAMQRLYLEAVARVPARADELFNLLMRGMLDALDDRYASYLDAARSSSITDLSDGSFGGVGLYIEAENQRVVVTGVVEDGPAYRAGISAFDTILAVDQRATAELSLLEVQQLIRGKVGSKVALSIQRNEFYSFNAEITRDHIELPTVKALRLEGDLLYLRVLQFTPFTSARFVELYRQLQQQGSVKGLIIDLRDNPGGLLDSSVEFADLFAEEGTIVSTRARVAAEERVFSAQRGRKIAAELPLVLLINGGTASAAEIVAGALHQLSQAWIIGSRSFGKGTVQVPFSLRRGVLKITVAHYYTASGVNLADRGIDPDQPLPEPKLQALSEAENQALVRTYQERVWQDFAQRFPQPSAAQLGELRAQLAQRGLGLQDELFEYLLAAELARATTGLNPAALRYDRVVGAAQEYLRRK